MKVYLFITAYIGIFIIAYIYIYIYITAYWNIFITAYIDIFITAYIDIHHLMYSYGPPHMAGQKQDNQHEHTFSSYVRIQDVAMKTCQRRWMIGKSRERGSWISVLVARHDNDDIDIFIIAHIYIYIYHCLLRYIYHYLYRNIYHCLCRYIHEVQCESGTYASL